ncbi:MAG: phosphate regulon transcriptional regulator PhoB [Methylococcales bacterium]|nr:phosphate regulon transcriptional regulator PhoB [Methylococcales bacterium]
MLNLLLIEDDHPIREMLHHFLTGKNFLVQDAKDGEQALDILNKTNPDLILLDWMLPDQSGPQIIKIIRKNPVQKDIPIIMLTARAEEMDKIEGLDAGADDYMAKPVSLQELYARIRALIRRSQGINEKKIITKGGISLDLDNNELKIQEKNIKIGPTEFRLLHYLMRRPNRLHTRSQLLDQVWGQGIFIEERTVDVHILRLRKLLKPYHVDNMIMTVRGAGYRFIDNPDE